MAQRKTKEFRTKDGKKVGVGDAVWSENHQHWRIVAIEENVGNTWASMVLIGADYDTLYTAAEDFPRYIYKSHPPKQGWEGCRDAGCQ